MIKHDRVFLHQLAHYLPENVISNEFLIENYKLKMKASWVEGRLGIKERRWVSELQTTSDLAVEALKKIANQEGPLVLSTISPDYLTPSTSSEIKRKIGWEGFAPAYDVAAACAGFIFSLEMGALLSQAHSTTPVYVAASEVRSRFLDLSDRRTVFLFADAAAVASLQKKEDGALAQLLWTSCSTQSRHLPEILIPAGGAKTPLTPELLQQGQNKIKMVDGVAITETVEGQLVDAVKNTLKETDETIADYNFFVFHQGNGQLILNILDQLGASADQTHITFGSYGNSSSASVAVTLSEAAQLGKIKSGQKILLVAMGAGYHLGLAGLRWC